MNEGRKIIMKKLLCILLALVLVLSATSALALGFTGETGNESTFETLQEAHINSAEEVNAISTNVNSKFVPHPILEGYPEGNTWVYRSANIYGGQAAARLNTNIFVYTDELFETKEEAKAYLDELGLIDIIEECTGSIVLVNPCTPISEDSSGNKVGGVFDVADVYPYYQLQTAMLAQKDTGTDAEGNPVSYSDAEYYGGYGYVYFIGIDGGATFFNNYIAPEIDFVGRLAGVLLIGGDMQKVRKVATFVPIYLAGAKEEIVNKYYAADSVDAFALEEGKKTAYNQAWPLRKVITVEGGEKKELVKDAYYNLFVKAMRVPVLPQAMHSGGTPYAGYNFDEAPYSLCDRHIVIKGRTGSGINYIAHQGDARFSDIKADNGEYMDVWYEYVPDEVLDNTAPKGSVPMILALHGGGDDARVFVEEFGLLELAAEERIAVVAPDHSWLGTAKNDSFEALVKYMLETYPSLDASRIYATGYSMGGGATYSVGYYKTKLFAGIAPFAGSATTQPEETYENFNGTDLPIIMSISAFDPAGRRLESLEGHGNAAEQGMIKTWTANNGIETGDFDFDKYPYFGLKADLVVMDTVNDEFPRYTYYLNNSEGEPRYAFTYVFDMIHALYPEYGRILWDYLKVFSRDQATGEIIYNPNVK